MPKEVSFVIRLDDKGTFKKVTVDAEGLGRAVRSVQDESEKAKRTIISWSEVSQAFDVLQNAISELQGFMTDLTSAYQVQLVAETQLQTIMRQRMGVNDEMIQSVKDLCSAQQELGVIGDEVQLSGAQQMATFLKSKQSLDVLIPAMNNLIAQQNGLNATNQDAVSIGNMMGKAMQGQVEVLQRVGITFTDAQKQVLQFGTESERAAMLAQVITDNVGNMNAELAKTDAGKWKQTENYLGDIKEQLGAMVQQYAPTITFLSQATIAASGIGKLATSFYSVGKALGIVKAATIAWNATAVRMSALATTCSASMRGAAVSATTLKLAIQGLMIATGVGVAVAALTGVISLFASSSDDAAMRATNMANAEKSAFDNIKQTYDSTLKQTYANLIAKYEQMKTSWQSMKSEHEKTQWVKNNKTAFEELGLKINSIADAENAFTKNTEKVKEAFEKRAQAAAYAAELVELYKQQLDLKNRKQNVDSTIKSARDKYNNSTSVSNQDNPYATENANRQANLAGVISDMARGGDGNIDKLNANLKTVNTKIAETKTALKGLGNVSMVDPGSGGGKTSPTKTSTIKTDKKDDPLKGSIDWYTKAIDEKKRQLSATANEATAKSLNNEMEALQRELYFLKVRIGVEVPPPIEVKKAIKPMAEQLQESFDDMQKYLKEHPLQVQADPKRLEKLTQKMEDFEKIKGLGNVDLGNFEGVRKAMTDIQGIVDPTAKGFAAAGTACQALGGAMQQLGSDSAAAKAGLVMAAIGQLALSLATAMTDAAKQSWITWLAFGISGTAQLVSMVATISQFATGGIVGGNSKSGDRVLARVNSGEMILNAAQQAQLFAIANGRMQPTVNTDVLAGLMAGGAGGVKAGSVVGKIRGRDIVLVTANETRQMRRRSNIKI